VHGKANQTFNLVSDECLTINAYYASVPGGLNIIGAVGIRTVDNDGVCRDILVKLDDQCSVSSGVGGGELTVVEGASLKVGGIYVRKKAEDKVRVSVPNCDGINLVVYVICERGAIDMIRFQIFRGLNLRPTSHGILGT